MTALALVLCCAMVCGTVLALRRMSLRHLEAAESDDTRKALARIDVALTRADAALDALRETGKKVAELDSKVDTLRATAALRQM